MGGSAASEFPIGGGESGALIRNLDWSKTELGPIATWPAHLKATLNLMLPARAEIVLFWGPDYVALYNDEYAPTIGAKHPKALGRPARENWEELWDDLEPLLRGVRETGETLSAKDRPFYIERHGYPENVYFDISYSPVRDEQGRVAGVLCIVNETTQRVVAQQQLARTQERLTQALSAAGMVGIYDWNIQTDTMYSDAHFAEIFSVDREKAEEGAPLADYMAGIHPEDVERIAAAVNHTVATGERYVQEYRLVRPDGSVRWVDARGEIVYDEDRKPCRFTGAVVDITSQKDAQERQRLLLRETNHRLKNLFATIDALIGLSVRSARTPKDFADTLRGRLSALLKAKDLVRPGVLGAEHESESTTVATLVRTVLQPYDLAATPERMSVKGPDVVIGATAVTSLALALHETATNAVKYGALSKPTGTVRVTWQVEDGNLDIVWEETGGPEIGSSERTPGFGSFLTRRSIVDQLAGQIEHDWQRGGLNLRVRIPVSKLRQ